MNTPEVEQTKEKKEEHFRGGSSKSGKISSGIGLAASGIALETATSGSSAGSGLATVYCLKDKSSFFCQLLLFLNTLKMIIVVFIILALVIALGYFAYHYFYKSKGGASGKSKSRK